MLVVEVDSTEVLTLLNCPRCNGKHRNIAPIRLRGKKSAETHFVMCSNTSEPVLLQLPETTDSLERLKGRTTTIGGIDAVV